MTRTVSVALKAHSALAATTKTYCWKFRRTDGEIFAFTKLDADLTIDIGDGDGSITYLANNAGRLSAIDHVAGLQPDNASLQGVLSEDAISMEDLRNGLFHSADYAVFELNYEDLTQGTMNLQTGKVGEVQITDNGFSMELRPLTDAYNQRIGMLVSPLCRTDPTQTQCGVRLVPPTWQATTAYTVRQARDAATGSVVKPTTQNRRHYKCTTAGTSGGTEPTWATVVGGTTSDGSVVWTTILALSQVGTVSSVVDTRNFTASGINIDTDWWNYGTLEWLTGDNTGLKGEVKDDNGSGVLKLFLPAPNTIQVGDTFLVTKGCDNRKDTCKTVFDNIYNRRAEDFVPGTDVALDYPDAT